LIKLRIEASRATKQEYAWQGVFWKRNCRRSRRPRRQEDGAAAQQIADSLQEPPRRTLQYRLKYLVDHRRLIMEGDGR
jgi:hypothetical protein